MDGRRHGAAGPRRDGSLTELFGTADWDGGVVLHDIEVVDGRRLLLFSLQVAMNVNPDDADETLYVVDLDAEERTVVAARIGGWEFGTGRLHLADERPHRRRVVRRGEPWDLHR